MQKTAIMLCSSRNDAVLILLGGIMILVSISGGFYRYRERKREEEIKRRRIRLLFGEEDDEFGLLDRNYHKDVNSGDVDFSLLT